MAKNNAKLYDPTMFIQAGINPKTGLPLKFTNDEDLYINIKKLLRIKDEQTAVNRVNWYNTMTSLNSMEIERFYYYKYSLIYFYLEGQFYIMPYALNGGIDFYGRENYVNPVPFSDSNDEATQKQKELLSTIKLKVIKEPMMSVDYDDLIHSCVILRDYTPQSNIQHAIPRSVLQDSVIDFESRVLPYLRTAMINSTGVQGITVSDSDEYKDVIEASNTIDEAALKGKPWIPLLSKLQKQFINDNGSFNSQSYLMAMQGIDNFRESMYGLNTQGLFTKSQHTNDSENAMNRQQDFPLADCIKLRQDACTIINSIWGNGMWCELSETALNIDRNGDMVADDSKEASKTKANLIENNEDNKIY